jgi:hypothetical protein
MLGRELALASARNYRLLRQHGITIRKTIDVMIATFASIMAMCCCMAIATSRR